jgi:hypothetical protein
MIGAGMLLRFQQTVPLVLLLVASSIGKDGNSAIVAVMFEYTVTTRKLDGHRLERAAMGKQ